MVPHNLSGRFGALMWIVQPLYLLTEILTATRVSVSYSLVDNTISDLGATTCTSIPYPHDPVPVCSAWHPVLNGSFIVFGLFLALGAFLIKQWLPDGRWTTTSVVLWIVSGLSSIGTGLVPLDQNLELHVLVSSPVFVAQPFALVTLGLALRGHHRVLAWSTVAVGVFSLVWTGVFFARVEGAAFSGLLERLSLWPGYLWLPIIVFAVMRFATRRDADSTPAAPEQRERH